MSRKRRVIVVLLLLATAALGGWLWSTRDDGDQGDGIALYGNVDLRTVDLAFNVPGRLQALAVEEGDAVAPRQPLARLDDRIYRAEVAAAQAELARQRQVLTRLRNGSRPQEIERARAEVAAIAADLKEARLERRRVQNLAKDDFASQQLLDTANARVASLAARLDAARQTLSLAIEGPRKEDIAAAEAQVAAAEASLSRARQRLDYTRLRAPVAGTVITRVVEPGAVLLANAPVVTVAVDDPVWVRTYVPETLLGKVDNGMAATVTSDSNPDHAYQAWVGFISPVAEFTPKTVQTPELRTRLVYRLRVHVKNPDRGLRQGMPVTVHLLPGQERQEEGTASPAGQAAS